jgi:hypothetical protein
VATLSFATTDRKVFTPISAALGSIQNTAGTMIVLLKKSLLGNTDYCAVTDSGLTFWNGSLGQDASDFLRNDRNHVYTQATAAATDDTSNWWIYATDWAAGAASLDRFHFRNQTSLGSFTHTPSTVNNGGAAAGVGTGGWLRLGSYGDESTGTKAMAVVAIWGGTRFGDSDYNVAWNKTSDLYKHPLGTPSFLCELTATTLVDLTGGSTYSSANGSGTTLTGGDPDNWTFDGVGTAPVMTSSFNAIPFMEGLGL